MIVCLGFPCLLFGLLKKKKKAANRQMMAQMVKQGPDADATRGPIDASRGAAELVTVMATEHAAILRANAAKRGHQTLGGEPGRHALVAATRGHHGQSGETNVVEDAGTVAAVQQHDGGCGTAGPQQRRKLHRADVRTLSEMQHGRSTGSRWPPVPGVQDHQQLGPVKQGQRGQHLQQHTATVNVAHYNRVQLLRPVKHVPVRQHGRHGVTILLKLFVDGVVLQG